MNDIASIHAQGERLESTAVSFEVLALEVPQLQEQAIDEIQRLAMGPRMGAILSIISPLPNLSVPEGFLMKAYTILLRLAILLFRQVTCYLTEYASLRFTDRRDTAPVEHESNWLPAPAGYFKLMLRAYLPGRAILDGEYHVPPIMKVP